MMGYIKYMCTRLSPFQLTQFIDCYLVLCFTKEGKQREKQVQTCVHGLFRQAKQVTELKILLHNTTPAKAILVL